MWTMLYKPRTKPNELIILERLNRRMKLNHKVKQDYFNLLKGYEGELLFDSFTEKIQNECFILNDLLFEVNNTTFQIDSLILFKDHIYIYEVKNFEGDYYIEADKLFRKPRFEVIHPLHQLSRCASLLRQLLLSLGYNSQINSSVVFIHPNFTLYQAPLDKPIIFQTQLKRYIENLNTLPSILTNKHKKLAEQLLALHKSESPYKRLPVYNYEQLQKGIICLKCNSFSGAVDKNKYSCNACEHKEPLDEVILRGIKEFKILFPDKKLTTNIIHDWCQIVPERRIRNILLHHFTKIGNYRWTYFE